MKTSLGQLLVVLLCSFTSLAQPFSLGTNQVDGSPFSCVSLNDRGTYKRIILQANQSSSSATWEFPQTCSFPGDVWRPYGSGTAATPFNVIVPPVPGTGSALYNSGNGGSSGNLPPITNGRYYTFNIQNVASGTNAFMGILETVSAPVDILAVTQSPGATGISPFTEVQLTVTTSAALTERVFVRYTTNNFTTSTIEQVTFVGTVGTVSIPAQPLGTSVAYYVYSSTKSRALINTEVGTHGQLVHDMSTLQWNNNGGSNYSYTVTNGTVLVNGTNQSNDGYYTTLKAAIDAVNSGIHTGRIQISLLGNTVETGSVVVQASGTGSANYSSLRISPLGFVSRTVTGDIVGPLIDLNGADSVTIDGIDAAGNTLTLENVNTGVVSTVRLINDAQFNQIRNCTILGASTSNTTGTILFSTASTTPGGNSNNTVSNCFISKSGVNTPTSAITSIGTAVTWQENISNTIDNCRISDFFNAASITYGIQIGAGNGSWTISNNRLFQSAGRTFTSANTHRGISIASGAGYQVQGNRIGFADADGNGSYSISATVALRFIGFEFISSVLADTSYFDGNTVAGISIASSSGASTTNGVLCGIQITGGHVVLGKTLGNLIGRTTGVGSLVVTATTAGALNVGINCSSTGTVRILRSRIGGLTSSGATASLSGSVVGINISGNASFLELDSNVVGNSSSENMRGGISGFTTGSSVVSGIAFTVLPNTSIVTRNTIQNLASFGTSSTGNVRGITTPAAQGISRTITVTQNVVRYLKTDSRLATAVNGLTSCAGIAIASGLGNRVEGNEVYQLSNTGTAALGTYVSGISLANATNTAAIGNRVYDLSNASSNTLVTAPGVAVGIVVRSGTTSVTIVNNMISLGDGQGTNTSFIGIQANNGSTPDPTSFIWHNTVRIGGTAANGAQPSFAMARTDFLMTARLAAVDLRNNIFVNTRTGGTGLHLAIANNYGATTSSATGWASNANVLNAAGSSVAWWTSALSFNDWKTTSAGDANSYSGIAVTFVDPASDLHLNMGLTPTSIESSGLILPSVTTDFDGQDRPGPAGSVNGGGIQPDLGADEIDAVGIDNSAPLITITPASFTCSTGDRVIEARIADLSGVPTSGPLMPRLYYKKGVSGSFQSIAGILLSGSSTNGTWAFTLSAAALGGLTVGDEVFYFVVAQDLRTPTSLIASIPEAGFTGVDVNTISTPPTSLLTYQISATLSGTYTVGLGGNFTTLTAAATAYNNSCLNGAVTFELIDDNYTSEAYPIVFQPNSDASAVNRLLIRPAAGKSPVFSGLSSTALLQFLGADYIDVQGNAASIVPDGCSAFPTRSVRFEHTNAAANTAVMAIQTTVDNNPATFIRLINLEIWGGSNSTATGVHIGGATINSGAGANGNNDNAVLACDIRNVSTAIFTSGGSLAQKNRRNQLRWNSMVARGTAAIGRIGIHALFEDSLDVVGNQIAAITAVSGDVAGILLGVTGVASNLSTGSEVSNALVQLNLVDSIQTTGTGSAAGIVLGPSNEGETRVINNTVNRIMALSTSPELGVGVLAVGGTSPVRLYHNSIRLSGPAGSGASQPLLGVGSISSITPFDLRNNIISVTGVNGADLNTAIGLGYTAATGNYPNLTSQNNILHVDGAGSSIARVGALGSTGTTVTSLASWQAASGKEANSQAIAPVFLSDADLHLDGAAAGNSTIDRAGTLLTTVTTDRDCSDRSAVAPDPGSDEFYASCSVSQLAATAGGGAVCQTDVAEVTDRYTTTSGCGLIARIERSGAQPVSGNIQACVSIDASVQVYNGDPYVQRHFNFIPARDPSTATATITLYATQAEFTAYNAANGAYPNLPTGPADAAGIANLRVTQFGGTGTAPGNYSGATTFINPDDAAILWDAVNNWWTIRFDIIGFSGFYIHTTPTGAPLPIRLVRFDAQREAAGNRLNWELACSGTQPMRITLERQGMDQRLAFEPIQSWSLDATACARSFSWLDELVTDPVHFYRLKWEEGSSVRYSAVLRLASASVNQTLVRVFPTVVRGQQSVSIEWQSGTGRQVEARLLDMTGRELHRYRLASSVGANRVSILLPPLAAGIYQWQFVQDQHMLGVPVPLIRAN